MLSRSTPPIVRLILAAHALGFSVAVAVAVGCSTQSADAFIAAEPTPPLDDQTNNPPIPTLPTLDASAGASSPYRGNPLCYVGSNDCMPDDDASHLTTGTQVCATLPPDAGDAGPGTFQSFGCRLERDTVTGTVGTACKKTSSVAGNDGASCETGADCAAGFDCIGGDKGKACRHYCCAGSCKDHLSQSGGATFCDVQGLVDLNQKAPVCVPLKRCTLLSSGECASNESCAVVTESGDTGCVTVGEQQVGAPCDADHCAAGLTCLGKAGTRKCFKLCKVPSNDCGAAQVCTTSTVFKDRTFGICQKP